jgi:hypothetical protein
VALTIVEAAKIAANNGEFKKAGVLASFAESSPLLRAMPIVTIPGNSYAYARQAELPTVAFRAVNSAFTPNEGKLEIRTEALKLIGGEVDVDRALVQQMGADVRSVHEQMKSIALGQTIGQAIVKGAVATDANGFDGLKVRYGGASPTASSQIIPNGGSASALSLKKLDQAIDAVDKSIGRRYIICNQATRRNITAFLRTSSQIQVTRDEYGNQVYSYAGLDMLELDQNGNRDGSAAFGDSSNTDSLYVVAMGEGGMHMIQGAGGISVRDLGEIPTAPVFRTRIDWACGLVDEHVRCVARLYNFTNVDAVA